MFLTKTAYPQNGDIPMYGRGVTLHAMIDGAI